MPAARLALAPLALCCAGALAGGTPTWSLDPVHTRVVFAVDHAGFSKAIGTVSGSRGELRFDPDDWAGASLEVEVPVSRIDLGDARWNEATLAPRLLDAQRHPWARFVSTHVEPVDAAHARVCGELTLRAVTQPLCLDVTVNAVKRHPMPPFRRTAGFSATGTLSRAAFGIDAWSSMVGDTVELRIEAEAVRSRIAEPADSETDVSEPAR
jgi:polyisoprenoid-binding protein YceI